MYDLLETQPLQPVHPVPLPGRNVVAGVETEDGVVENVGTARHGHVVEEGSQPPPDGVAAVEPDNLYFNFYKLFKKLIRIPCVNSSVQKVRNETVSETAGIAEDDVTSLTEPSKKRLIFIKIKFCILHLTMVCTFQ